MTRYTAKEVAAQEAHVWTAEDLAEGARLVREGLVLGWVRGPDGVEWVPSPWGFVVGTGPKSSHRRKASKPK